MPIQTELNRSSNYQNINYFDISKLYPSWIVIHIISAVYGIVFCIHDFIKITINLHFETSELNTGLETVALLIYRYRISLYRIWYAYCLCYCFWFFIRSIIVLYVLLAIKQQAKVIHIHCWCYLCPNIYCIKFLTHYKMQRYVM